MSTKLYITATATERIEVGDIVDIKIDERGHATASLAKPEDVPGKEEE